MGPESAQEGLPGGVRAPNVSKKSELQVLKNHRFPDAPFCFAATTGDPRAARPTRGGRTLFFSNPGLVEMGFLP